MKRTVAGLAFAATFLLLVVAQPVAASPGATATWQVSTSGVQAPQGPVFDLYLRGPANASYLLTVNAAPFNVSVPVFEAKGNLTPVNNSTGSAVVRFPTLDFPTQLYQVNVLFGSLTVAQAYFLEVLPFNTSNLAAQQAQDEQTQIRDENRIAYQGGVIADLQRTVSMQYWLLMGAVVTMGLIVLYAKLGPNVASRAHRLWKTVHDLHWSTAPPGYTATFDGPPSSYVVPSVEGALWVSDYCPECRTSKSQPGIIMHLADHHKDKLGPEGPVKGRHYWLSDDEARARFQRDTASDTSGVRTSRRKERERRSVHISEVG